jgi:hypothetical protein
MGSRPREPIIDYVDILHGRYHDTEHYRITRAFLNRPEQLLQHLFEDDAQSGPAQ